MQTDNPRIETHWLRWLCALWVVLSCVLVAYRWTNIDFFILSDTDDNLRLAQVKAWLGGQGWYDLKQYRLDPPFGADIHWSRLPDVPIAGLITLLTPVLGSLLAEKLAIGIAPLLPFGVALFGVALAVRRLVHVRAWPFAAILLFSTPLAMAMFLPTRIDHHGWQLAFLALALAGLADPRRRRGGMTTAFATAASLAVGLEMLPYLAVCGGLIGLRWVCDEQQAPRLRAYGVALGLGVALGYLLFASQANHALRCDALTPIWLSTLALAGGAMTALSFLSLRHWGLRLGAGAIMAAGLVGFFGMSWPQCLARPEGISDALYRIWFVNIMEVRPLPEHDLKTALPAVALPVIGLASACWLCWRDRAQRIIWAQFLVLSAVSLALMFWQLRAGPAAEVIAVPAAAALAWSVVPPLSRSRWFMVRVFGVSSALLLISGLVTTAILAVVPQKARIDVVRTQARQASAACTTLSALRPIAHVPPGTIFTFVDLSPRLIAMTPHNAIAGPYHRNGAAILDVFHAFRGSAGSARQIMQRHRADYVLICANTSEARNHIRAAPKGFLAQLQKGQVPAWLTPIALPDKSPFQMWKIKQPH